MRENRTSGSVRGAPGNRRSYRESHHGGFLVRQVLRERVEGIQKILMAHHAAGVRLPTACKGSEREILVREFLAKVLPPPFRFGTGMVMDSEGRMSGQLDIVVEFPFLPSFPTPGAPERVYLADSVAFVVEVKSNLSTQWGQVEDKAAQMAPLRRNWTQHWHYGPRGYPESPGPKESQIPFIAVGFEGFATANSLKRKIASIRSPSRVHGAAVVESGAYACTVQGTTPKAEGVGGLFALCVDAAYLARNVIIAQPELSGYLRSDG